MSNAGDPTSVANAARREKDVVKQAQAFFLEVMNTVAGRAVIWEQLTRARLFESSFTGNSTTFFNEGMRNVGLMLMQDINSLCPELYLTMLQEAKNRETRNG